MVALIRLPHSLGTEGLSWKPIGLGSWHSQTPQPIHLIIHPRHLIPPTTSDPGWWLVRSIPQPKYRNANATSQFSAPQRPELPFSSITASTSVWTNRRHSGPDARGANPDSLHSASVRVFWGRLPVLIRRPYSVESDPGPWDLLEAVKHARAYLRGKATRQTEQEGE